MSTISGASWAAYLSGTPWFYHGCCGVCVAQSLVSYTVVCWTVFKCVFKCKLFYCLSIYDLSLLIKQGQLAISGYLDSSPLFSCVTIINWSSMWWIAKFKEDYEVRFQTDTFLTEVSGILISIFHFYTKKEEQIC